MESMEKICDSLKTVNPGSIAVGVTVVGGRRTTFPRSPAVSSSRRGLTSLFGMGRGAPPRHSRHLYLHRPFRMGESGHKDISTRTPLRLPPPRGAKGGLTEAFGPLVPLGSTCRHAHTCGLSTSSSPTALKGGLISGPASRLDAFSAYPLRTRLPGSAPGGATGSPLVRPTRSSRTKVRTPQASDARNR